MAAAASVATLVLTLPAYGQSPTRVAVWFLGFNTTQPPFNDAAVRKAVARAIDRARLARAAKNNPAVGLEPPGCLAHDPNSRMYPYEPQQAKELIANAGIKTEDLGDLGLWVLSWLTGPKFSQEELEILGANLAAIGLQAKVRQFGSYNAFEKIALLPVVKMSYWGVSMYASTCSQLTFLDYLARSKGEFNFFGYNNPEVDSLIQRAKTAGEGQAKVKLFQEAQQRFLDDAVLVPVWWETWR